MVVGVNIATYDVTTIVIVSYNFLMYRSCGDDVNTVTLAMVMLTALIIFCMTVGCGGRRCRHRYADLARED